MQFGKALANMHVYVTCMQNLSDECSLQSDGFEESIDGNTRNNFGSPPVNPTYIAVCQCREQSGLFNTSYLCLNNFVGFTMGFTGHKIV